MLRKNMYTIVTIVVALALIVLVVIITNDRIRKLEETGEHGDMNR